MLLRDEVYITQLDIYVRNTTKHAINIPNLYKVMYRIRLFVTEYFVVFQFAKKVSNGWLHYCRNISVMFTILFLNSCPWYNIFVILFIFIFLNLIYGYILLLLGDKLFCYFLINDWYWWFIFSYYFFRIGVKFGL